MNLSILPINLSKIRLIEFSFESLCCPLCRTTYSSESGSSNYPLMLGCGYPICSFCLSKEISKTEDQMVHTQICPLPHQCYQVSEEALIVIDLLRDLVAFSEISPMGIKPTPTHLQSLNCPHCNNIFDNESMGPSMPQILDCGHAVCQDCISRNKYQKKTKTYPFFIYEYKCSKCKRSTPVPSKSKYQKRNFITEFLLELKGPRTRRNSECSEQTSTTGSINSITKDIQPTFSSFSAGLEISSNLPRTSTKLSESVKIDSKMNEFYKRLDRQKMDEVMMKEERRQMNELIELNDWADGQDTDQFIINHQMKRMKEERRRLNEEKRLIGIEREIEGIDRDLGEEWRSVSEERKILDRERRWIQDQMIKAEEARNRMEETQRIHRSQQETLHNLILEQNDLLDERLRLLEIKKMTIQKIENQIEDIENGNKEEKKKNEMEKLPDSPPFGLPLELWTIEDVCSWALGETGNLDVVQVLMKEKIDGNTLNLISFKEICDLVEMPLGDMKRLWSSREKLRDQSSPLNQFDHPEGKRETTHQILNISKNPPRNSTLQWCRNSLRKSFLRKKKNHL